MVNATVDNTPVKEVISNGSSVTVPTGETWKVTINVPPATSELDGDRDYRVRIDGTWVGGSSAQSEDASDHSSGNSTSTVPFDAVLPEGTTIGASGSAVLVTGFVIN